MEIVSKSPKETQKIAALLAREAAALKGRRAVVLALTGNLGAGKTTFVQGFAASLGIKETLASPTFVIMKAYALRHATRDKRHARTLVHIDAYRLKSGKDLASLGIRSILRDPHAIVVIEWAERITHSLPRDAVWLHFTHGRKSNERRIKFQATSAK